jgi:hypothetical protein
LAAASASIAGIDREYGRRWEELLRLPLREIR